MAASTNKKVLVRRYDRETLAGHVNPALYLQPEGVELVSTQGNTVLVPYPDVKSVAFVRDFEADTPERQVFQTRPKMPGLWVSLQFRDGDRMEGIVPNNLLLLENIQELANAGPPIHANTQRQRIDEEADTSLH